MTKTNKILIITISSILFIALVIGIILIVSHINNEKPDGSVHTETLKGKIIEMNDDVIVIEITAERSSLAKLNERVKIRYDDVSAELYESGKENVDVTDKYEMQIGDIVNVQFWEKDLETKDDMKYIDLQKCKGSLSVYFSDFENREFL